MHRDFDALRRERQRQAPTTAKDVTFTLGGVTFTCVKTVPSGLIFDIAAAPEYDVNPLGALVGLRDFIMHIVVPEQREAFLEMLRGPDDPADFETLEELARYLSEEYLGRPTVPSSASPDGRLETGPSSKRVSLSARTVEVIES